MNMGHNWFSIHRIVACLLLLPYNTIGEKSLVFQPADHLPGVHRRTNGLREEVDMTLFMERVNATLDPVVDASLTDMAHVYRPGNLCPFQRKVASKMIKGETINVFIVGGSVTWGADLRDRLGERWSNSFTQILNSGWYKGKFEVNNIGVPACNIDVWIDKVSDMKEADLVIVDLSVNDQGFDLQALPHLYSTFIQLIDALPNHPALLFHQAFRTGKNDKREWASHCPNVEDQGKCCGGFVWCKRWWDMQDFVAIALHRYSIPFISYRDLAWPVYAEPPSDLNQWWNGMSHPDAKAHAMMAKMIAYAVGRQVKEAHMQACDQSQGLDPGGQMRYVAADQADASVQPICSTPLTQMRAGEDPQSVMFFQPLAPPPVVWKYYNDSQLKFGWILEAGGAIEHSTISFKVLLGESPRLQISFLKSYSPNMGKVAIWIDDFEDQKVYIDGRWEMEQDYSVTHVVTLSREPLVNISTLVLGQAATLPTLAPGEHTLHLSLPAEAERAKPNYKWKLLGIHSC
ncbi:hypothetical protein B484DRAFT_291843 [Ochromonadaceae sp. CCMP2298]|nr:hypothetical protein B484DRAFT_291843 [Ochromonadaceae sp. CCMP2298]